ncbi:WG repeat-containing protein [Segatella salivae]|uniref:WG repeat-containing protein n=1 Tax=Segatella salivae TaxID=228604 RepID=UPI001CB111FC|nr:WG repeat-containing protein [Segatella salivae]MBF1560045.1 WG repeat-containing protein [Segatella salivae]
MRKTITLFLLLFTLSTISLNAQVGVALYLEKASICKQTNGKFSLNDFHKKPIIADADTIFSTHFDCFVVSKAGQKGLYDAEGKCLLPITFSNISFDNNRYWLVNKDGKQGLYTYMGKEIMPPRYDSIEVISNYRTNAGNYFIVKKGLYGLCNNEGKFIVDPQYTAIKYRYLRYFKLTKGDSCHYLFNYKDIIKDITLDDAMPITMQRNEQNLFYFNYKQGKAWGLLRENGQPIIAVQYDKPLQKVGYIHSDSTAYFIACKDNLFGLIDINNKIVLPFQYKNIQPTYLYNTIELTTDEGKQLYNMTKKQLALNLFYDKSSVSDRYLYLKRNGLETAVDCKHMQLLFPFKYNSIFSLDDNEHFIVTTEGKTAVVNRQDKQLIPYGYDEIKVTSKPNLFIIKKENQYGIVNLKNELVYGMTPYHIEAYNDHIELTNISTWETIKKLDYNLKEIK